MIGYGKQTIREQDIQAVKKALKDDFLTTGPKVAVFEKAFAEYVGSKYAVAVSNGTAALHLSAIAIGLGPGDEVITTPMTFAASANCALYCRAKPIFVDIDRNGQIDPETIMNAITPNSRAIIPVDYSGEPCDMEEISRIAGKHNLKIIRDSCHALGAEENGIKLGSCAHGETTIFSFHPVKHITTGEGGMITTNDEQIYEKLVQLRHHGIDMKNKTKDEPWFCSMKQLGFNYRLTDFQCALGIEQLRRVEEFVTARRSIARRYDEAFAEMPSIEQMKISSEKKHSYHIYVLKLRDAKLRLPLYEYLREHDVFCQVHYAPVYQHDYYQSLGYEMGLCPKAEDFYSRILSLPVYPDLSVEEQDNVIMLIKEWMVNK